MLRDKGRDSMGVFKKLFSREPEDIVARAPESKLEELAKSSEDKNIRYRAAERMKREDIWQYMALHDAENYDIAMLKCKDLKFLEKLAEQKPDEKYFIHEHMDRIAFPVVEKKVDAINDQEKLLELAMNAKTDIPEYQYLYMKSSDRIRTHALYKISKQEDLFRIARKRGDMAEEAISRITDPDLLVKIVLEFEGLRSWTIENILSRLNDTEKLQYIAEHSKENNIVYLAKKRIKEERSRKLCPVMHDWVTIRTETDDDGDSPRFDYVYEKCQKCGLRRCSTYIAGRFNNADLSYDEME